MTNGYKQWDAGSIPPDWGCSRLGDATASSPNAIVGGPFGSDLVSSDYQPSGTPVIRGQNMSGSVVSGEFVFVSQRKATLLSANLARPHDLVFTQRGTLGQVSLVPEGPFDKYVISQSQMKVTLDPSRYDPVFVRQYFASSEGQKQIVTSAIQTGVPHTNLGILRGYHFPAPSLREQRAIAEALSDVDWLVQGLEALINKRRAIKQAAMQQLLTGKTRLPSFSGKWETNALGDIAEIWNGATPSTHIPAYWNGTIPWCTPTDITGTAGKYLLATERSITAEGLASCSAKLLPAGALLLCSRATIGELKIAVSSVCTNQGFKSLVCRAGISNEFLYYLLLTLKPQLLERAIGSTFLEIGKRDVASLQLEMPTYDEQQAIATVLFDMDAEIAALEARRDKTRAIKQGMMQQLLTGRVRLVPPDSPAA